MNKRDIKTIQNRVIKLLKRGNNKPLSFLCKDSCSEMSRLVGCWIIKEYPTSKIFIYKGKNVFNKKNKNHDILIVISNKIYILDPTIWQFKKNKKSILIKELEGCVSIENELNKIYKGKWKISERINTKVCKEVDSWKKIITENINS